MMNQEILYRRAFHVFYEYKPIEYVQKFFNDRMTSAIDQLESVLKDPNCVSNNTESKFEAYRLLNFLHECLIAIEIAIREGKASAEYTDKNRDVHQIRFEKKYESFMRVTFFVSRYEDEED